MKNTILPLAAVLAAIPALGFADTKSEPAAESAAGWPQFRGPSGDGVARDADPPVRWSATENVVWKVALPGRGRSSPVLQGDRIWLTTAVERNPQRTRIGPDDMQVADHIALSALCLNRADGRILWQTPLFAYDKPDPVHWLNSWATPTPVIEADRLYCDFGTFGTACLDRETGAVRWQRRIPLDHQVGPGSSPVLWENLLILVRDGRDAQFVTALDKRTGETAWKTVRPPLDAPVGELKKSFSTPLLVTRAGGPQLISPGAHWAVAYEPASGKEIWRVRHGNGFSIGTCPVAAGDLVFFGTGCFKAQLWAVRLDGAGDVTASHAVWKSLRQIPVMSSPVVVGEELYWVSDDGMACGAEARSGAMHWQERLGGSYLASPLAAAGRVYFFSQEGKTTVVKAGREFVRLAENTLEGPLVASPAAVARALYLRTDQHLYRLEQR